MKRVLGVLFAGALTLGAVPALGHDGEHGTPVAAAGAEAAAKGKSTTVTGEVVDMGCYLGHGSTGAKHKECAFLCINSKGMPMGLLTAAGELYLLTPPHDNPDAYKKLKEWAAKRVEVSGKPQARSGIKSIEVATAKLAPASNTP